MISGVIFDMDGVISDTQKIHSRVESELLGKFGIAISPEEITLKYSGVKTSEFFNELLSK
jgi:beta-phosphoglucomutase-like phosphatase (HAD superfamily)